MIESTTFWEDSASVHRHVKFESSREREASHPCKEERSVFRCCEGNLNFATIATSEDDEYSSYQKKKVSRDPMSHRIIEKRRRDRMNNCLADLSRLIPANYLKKGRGRIEKTEIIEMAIKHMKHLQAHACHQSDTCELAHQQNQEDSPEPPQNGGPIVIEHYRLGYQECLSEAMHFLVEVEGFFAGDPLCVQLINHLQKHCDKILKGDRLNFPRTHNGETASTSSNSSGGYNNHNGNTMPSGSSGHTSSSPTGSCSDTGRSENKDMVMSNNIPQTRTSQIVPAPSAEGDDGCYEDGLVNMAGPSQLREMLTSSSLSSLQTSTSPGASLMTRTAQSTPSSVSQHLQPLQSPVPSFSSAQYSLGANSEQNCGNGSAASLYKFKNNIKQRFTAEHHPEDNGITNPVVPNNDHMHAKRKRYLTDAVQEFSSGKNLTLLGTMRRDSETCSIPSSPASPPSALKYPPLSPSPDMPHSPPPLKPTINPSPVVPIFALHATGAYYIPLTLEPELLIPYQASLGIGLEANALQNGNSADLPLHPVTISVKFIPLTNHQRVHHNQQHSRQQPNNFSTLSTWRNELNGFVPIPRWPVYSPDRN